MFHDHCNYLDKRYADKPHLHSQQSIGIDLFYDHIDLYWNIQTMDADYFDLQLIQSMQNLLHRYAKNNQDPSIRLHHPTPHNNYNYYSMHKYHDHYNDFHNTHLE